MHNKKILLTLFMLCAFFAEAQQKTYDTTTIKLFDDIETVQSVYAASDHISFTATYYMEDVDSVTVRDTSVAEYKISGEKFWMQIDSVESIQNDYYFGTIYHDNKALVVQKPIPLPKQVLGVNIKDSMFQQLTMTGLTYADSSSFRKITISLNSYSPLTHYEVLFDKTNYRVNTIKYSMRKEQDTSSLKRINMVIKFTNYKTGFFDNSIFSTDTFFKVNSSTEIMLGSALSSDYEVINMLSNN